jgi:hypothetical protein
MMATTTTALRMARRRPTEANTIRYAAGTT